MVETKRLTPPTSRGLRAIQQDFARYQAAAFPARSTQFFALELAGECGELANLEKKAWRDPSKAPPEEKFAEEATDVLIALINYANTRGIDLEATLAEKLAEIEERRVAGKMGAVK